MKYKRWLEGSRLAEYRSDDGFVALWIQRWNFNRHQISVDVSQLINCNRRKIFRHLEFPIAKLLFLAKFKVFYQLLLFNDENIFTSKIPPSAERKFRKWKIECNTQTTLEHLIKMLYSSQKGNAKIFSCSSSPVDKAEFVLNSGL